MFMKNLKRLQLIEIQLSTLNQITMMEEEYLSWVKQHPLGGADQEFFDFNKWLNTMPLHLISSFQSHVRKIFDFL